MTKLDRLTRRTRDLLELVEDVFKPYRAELVSLSEQLDTRTPAGVLMLPVLGALPQMEREQITERTRSALRYKRDKGDRLGTTPLGYQTVGAAAPMLPDRAELVTVRLILRRRRADLSFGRIAVELAAAGHRTKRGGGWYVTRCARSGSRVPPIVRFWQQRPRRRRLGASVHIKRAFHVRYPHPKGHPMSVESTPQRQPGPFWREYRVRKH